MFLPKQLVYTLMETIKIIYINLKEIFNSVEDIHQNKLLHRSAHILVFNSQKELFLQMSAQCYENPVRGR